MQAKFFILILSIIVLTKTVSYGIYEYKNAENKAVGIFIIVLGFLISISATLIEFLG